VRRADIRIREEDIDAGPLNVFHVPPVPSWWMHREHEVTFRLEPDEADFLRSRLSDLHPRCLLGIAAARLKRRERPTGKSLWDDSFMREAAEALDAESSGPGARLPSVVGALRNACGASAVAELVRAIYASLVEVQREADLRQAGRPLPEDIEAYREWLRGYWQSEREIVVSEARALDLMLLEGDISLPRDLRPVLAHVLDRIRTVRKRKDVDRNLLDSATTDLFTRVERGRKRSRARLPERDGRTRREGFDGKTLRVTGIDYRYRVARRLLLDLHEGLFP
jgi:hypothetical protein